MSTDIRPEISKDNKYYISRHRYYELKHFCLQFKEWQVRYSRLENCPLRSKTISENLPGGNFENYVEKIALEMAIYSKKMQLVIDTCEETDPELSDYIFKAVTEGLSYTNLKTRLEIPCDRNTFYDRYRKFFKLLDQKSS